MTSNPKSVQNGQRASPNFLAFWVREVLGRGQCRQITAQSPSVNNKTIYQTSDVTVGLFEVASSRFSAKRSRATAWFSNGTRSASIDDALGRQDAGSWQRQFAWGGR
jgi:hypothetical protein